MIHSGKFQDKYVNLAKAVARENDACYSRQLGVVIVDKDHKVRGIGYNGPPRGTPHTDSAEYLGGYFWNSLKDNDKLSLFLTFNAEGEALKRNFIDAYEGKKVCPRKILGCKSGERPLLCSCVHAESNAIANSENVVGCAMYCATPIPCLTCTGIIINAGIKEIFCTDERYHTQSQWLFEQAGVKLVTYSEP